MSPPLSWPLPSHRRFWRSRGKIRRLLEDLVQARRAGHEEAPADTLSALMQGRDPETGSVFSDAQLVDQAVTLLGAGHDSTATGLAWTFWLLATHPEHQEALAAEARAVLGGRPAVGEDRPRLPLAEATWCEGLRLYPPLWAFSRRCVVADELDGHEVPAGCELFLSPYITHRHPEFWSDPERFDPGRFLGAAGEGRHRFAWLPFGGGPRGCIGDQFARLEGTLLLATLLQRFRVEPVTEGAPVPEPSITLRPKGGLPLRLVERA